MLIVKIDNFHVKPPQTSFARFAHIIRFPADAAKCGLIRIAQNSELCRDHHLLAMTLERATEQFFIRVRPVHVGGVEKCDAELERPMNRRERFIVITSAIKIRHAHATESQGGNDWTTPSKFALFHNRINRRKRR